MDILKHSKKLPKEEMYSFKEQESSSSRSIGYSNCSRLGKTEV